jgi:molybdenum cofactor cytidylyltransferase
VHLLGWVHQSNYCNGKDGVYCDRLLRARSPQTAIAADCDPIIVVLGAYSDSLNERLRQRIQTEIIDLPVRVVNNSEWQTGMGSSIRVGIQALLDLNMDVEATILLLCDQPFVSPQIIWQLRSIYDSTHQPIVASSYQDTIGVPALFDRQLFSELLDLNQLEGAKTLIQRHLNTVKTIDFPQGSIDLDTPKDYQWILNNFPMSTSRVPLGRAPTG